MGGQFEFETVFSGPSLEAGLVKGYLEGEGLTAFLDEQYIGTAPPYLAGGSAAEAVEVWVAKADAERARDLLARRQHHA